MKVKLISAKEFEALDLQKKQNGKFAIAYRNAQGLRIVGEVVGGDTIELYDKMSTSESNDFKKFIKEYLDESTVITQSLEAQNKTLQNKVDELQKLADQLQKDLNKCIGDKAIVERENKNLNGQITTLEAEVKTLKGKLQDKVTAQENTNVADPIKK